MQEPEYATPTQSLNIVTETAEKIHERTTTSGVRLKTGWIS
jgi:hypothetical protein